MKIKRIVVLSDLHCAHRVGLTPTSWQIADNPLYKHFLTFEKKVWKFFTDTIKALQPIDILVVNGDCIEGKGEKSGSTELLEADRNIQCDIAAECINFCKAKEIIMTFGCLTAGHRVLTADLRYVFVETLKKGDKLFAFDENANPISKRRYWCESTVIENKPIKAEVYKLYLSDDTTLEVTGDHPFLLQDGSRAFKWVTVDTLYKRAFYFDKANNSGKYGDKKYLPTDFKRVLPVWDTDTTYEGGYIAGFLDGEGSLSQRRKQRVSRRNKEESHFTLNASQNDNTALKVFLECLDKKDIKYSVYKKENRKNIREVRIIGGISSILKLLGSFRPRRLLEKLNIDILGSIRNNYNEDLQLINIEYVGEKTVYALGTTSGTYVVEGFLSHNTPYHVGASEDFERTIAEKVNAKKIGGHEWLDVNGLIFDFKHKVGSSAIPHGRATTLLREQLWNARWHDRDEGQPLADILIRSHTHFHIFVGDPTFLAMTTPALQGYGSKYGARECSGIVDIGLIHFDVDIKGGYTWGSHMLKGDFLKVQPIKL